MRITAGQALNFPEGTGQRFSLLLSLFRCANTSRLTRPSDCPSLNASAHHAKRKSLSRSLTVGPKRRLHTSLVDHPQQAGGKF